MVALGAASTSLIALSCPSVPAMVIVLLDSFEAVVINTRRCTSSMATPPEAVEPLMVKPAAAVGVWDVAMLLALAEARVIV